MARDTGGRTSASGLSSMLIYHATIIFHDIFRTNNVDKNISDSSSYLDLSPLYGYTEEMQRKIRDDKYKLGLLNRIPLHRTGCYDSHQQSASCW